MPRSLVGGWIRPIDPSDADHGTARGPRESRRSRIAPSGVSDGVETQVGSDVESKKSKARSNAKITRSRKRWCVQCDSVAIEAPDIRVPRRVRAPEPGTSSLSDQSGRMDGWMGGPITVDHRRLKSPGGGVIDRPSLAFTTVSLGLIPRPSGACSVERGRVVDRWAASDVPDWEEGEYGRIDYGG